jgi:DNA replication and repair protein RecF
MHIEHLSIVNYKNIAQAEIDLSPKMNCFVGNNGMGKTNLIDAVYFLSFSKSHTNSVDSQNIKHESEFFVLEGRYADEDANNSSTEIYCGVKRHAHKVLKRNKKEYEKIADHIGQIPLVLVSPSDYTLISGGSDERRKFIDGVISQYDHRYLQSLLAYNRALQQRNSLIRNEVDDPLQYEVWEEQMAGQSGYIYQKRQEFIADFSPLFEHFYNYIAQQNEQVNIGYTSHLQQQPDLKLLLAQTRNRDRLIGYTTKGTHRDELTMMLDGYPLRHTGSQGQTKTYLIALKLAQFDFLSKIEKTLPILLFDDIFDKLDADRVQQIVKLMKEDNRFGQILITDTDREHITDIIKDTGSEYKIFAVANGNVEQASDDRQV